jgi:UDP-N-acetylglucosamine transferase subunit ALG13
VVAASSPLAFATVGTDHHRFDRLVQWIDDWMLTRREEVRFVIQTGTSCKPKHAHAVDYLEYEEMERLVGEATVVVTHGGPGNVMLCRRLGKKPIVVPRRSDLSEHVDDHQLLFSRRIALEGQIELAESERRLCELLDAGIDDEALVALPTSPQSVERAVQRFEQLLEAVLV